MTATPAPSATEPDRPAWAQAVYDRQLAMLSRVAEAGLEITLAIERDAKAINAGETIATPETLATFNAYPKIARALRLTLMLQDKLIRHLLGKDEPAARCGRRDEGPARAPITEIVRTIVDPDPDRFQRTERRERLDREAVESGLPTSELIAHICQDLGLDPEWSQMAAETWPQGDTLSAAPGWPIRCDEPYDYSARSP